jgi:hypothetical protein
MMKWLRIATEQFRSLAVLVFAASTTCVLVPGTTAAFSVGSLVGNYGCLGRTGALTSSSSIISGFSEIMRLNLDGAGAVKGRIILNLLGEVCSTSVSGTYSLKPSGLGSLHLAWGTLTSDTDEACATLNVKGVAQHTALVVESGGKAFDFQAADDFLTEPGQAPDSISGFSDIADPFAGSCKKE